MLKSYGKHILAYIDDDLWTKAGEKCEIDPSFVIFTD